MKNKQANSLNEDYVKIGPKLSKIADLLCDKILEESEIDELMVDTFKVLTNYEAMVNKHPPVFPDQEKKVGFDALRERVQQAQTAGSGSRVAAGTDAGYAADTSDSGVTR